VVGAATNTGEASGVLPTRSNDGKPMLRVGFNQRQVIQ
jgi:hypothetical protein